MTLGLALPTPGNQRPKDKGNMKDSYILMDRSRYRDAHNKMALHAEAIINFRGVAAETKRLSRKLEETLEVSKQSSMLMVQEHLAMRCVSFTKSHLHVASPKPPQASPI